MVYDPRGVMAFFASVSTCAEPYKWQKTRGICPGCGQRIHAAAVALQGTVYGCGVLAAQLGPGYRKGGQQGGAIPAPWRRQTENNNRFFTDAKMVMWKTSFAFFRIISPGAKEILCRLGREEKRKSALCLLPPAWLRSGENKKGRPQL